MDVLFRLRVLIWVFILSLWGVMVYQFLGEEEPSSPMNFVATRPANNPPPTPLPSEIPPESSAAVSGPMDFIKPLPPKFDPETPTPRKRAAPIRREAKIARKDPPIPPGFVKTPTPHFNIYSEEIPPSEEFLKLLENLHGNLMLDLAAFSPWARDEQVYLFLFKDQETYRKITGRPTWSGGASSVPKRKVYLYESDELTGILAHELCHIYYDGFFLDGKANPLWLSEGMSTLVQVERGLAAPNWLKENLYILRHEGGYSLPDLMSVNSTAGASDDNVRLWYTQSYSLVRFLIRSQYRSSFYNFSRYLRDGKTVSESLYRAYGAPFTSLKALEYAWRYDMNKTR